MSITLYTATMSRGFMVEWLLEELQVPYMRRTVDLFSGETQTATYRAIHPLGSVPALVVDGQPYMESLAMMLYLADAHPDRALAPDIASTLRPAYLQWMVYGVATIEPTFAPAFVRALSRPEAERHSSANKEERAAFRRSLEPLDDAMARTSILPCGFSAADVLLSSELYWAEQVGMLNGLDTARAYLDTMMQRPAFQQCHRRALAEIASEGAHGP